MYNDLATLVGSRICHDLISPIGAIGNGVELLELTGGETGSEIALISESVQSANARIRFFRIAFGAAKDDQMISRKDVLGILSEIARGGRTTYYWQIDGDHQRLNVRIAFLLLLCFESAMPLGGDVSVQEDDNDWVLTANAKRWMIDQERWDSLTDTTSSLEHSAAQVQFALLPSVLAQSGRTLKIETSDAQVTVRF